MAKYRMSFMGPSEMPVSYSPLEPDPDQEGTYRGVLIEGDTPEEAAANAKAWYRADLPSQSASPLCMGENVGTILLTTADSEETDEMFGGFNAYTFDYATLTPHGDMMSAVMNMFGVPR